MSGIAGRRARARERADPDRGHITATIWAHSPIFAAYEAMHGRIPMPDNVAEVLSHAIIPVTVNERNP